MLNFSYELQTVDDMATEVIFLQNKKKVARRSCIAHFWYITLCYEESSTSLSRYELPVPPLHHAFTAFVYTVPPFIPQILETAFPHDPHAKLAFFLCSIFVPRFSRIAEYAEFLNVSVHRTSPRGSKLLRPGKNDRLGRDDARYFRRSNSRFNQTAIYNGSHVDLKLLLDLRACKTFWNGTFNGVLAVSFEMIYIYILERRGGMEQTTSSVIPKYFAALFKFKPVQCRETNRKWIFWLFARKALCPLLIKHITM